MKLSEIHIRDPFILAENDTYYLYGTRGADTWGKGYGFDVYVSRDLETFSDPIEVFTPPHDFWSDKNFWAPEVHKYHGKYYMLASFIGDTRNRGTQILVADSPLGPFVPHSDGPVTPAEWNCLDGTLHVDADGTPYMIYCKEWFQPQEAIVGEIHAIRLTRRRF
jgi:beta-xylosidase